MINLEIDEILERTQHLTPEQRKIITAYLKRDLGDELTLEDKLALVEYYEQLKQQRELTEEERLTTVDYLLQIAQTRPLTNPERYLLLELSVIRNLIMVEDFSDRREDWYDDEGR